MRFVHGDRPRIDEIDGLSEQQSAEIRSRTRHSIALSDPVKPEQVAIVVQVVRDRSDLLAEVDRLRTLMGAYQLYPKCNGQKYSQTPRWWPGDRKFEWVGPGAFPKQHKCEISGGTGVIERPVPFARS
jgi:hypothetical protein